MSTYPRQGPVCLRFEALDLFLLRLGLALLMCFTSFSWLCLFETLWHSEMMQTVDERVSFLD